MPALAELHGLIVVQDERFAGGPCQGLTGEVILGGPKPTGDDHRIGTRRGIQDRRRHAIDVVADHRLPVVVEPGLGEALTNPSCVRVHDLAEEKFGSDGDDFYVHTTTSALTSVPYPPVTSTVSHSPGFP